MRTATRRLVLGAALAAVLSIVATLYLLGHGSIDLLEANAKAERIEACRRLYVGDRDNAQTRLDTAQGELVIDLIDMTTDELEGDIGEYRQAVVELVHAQAELDTVNREVADDPAGFAKRRCR